jgi:D-sedoheptulose 7-phosphate isomerase
MDREFAELAASARREQARLVEALMEDGLDALRRLADACAEALRSGGKLLLFGNGGSAAQAQHLAAEFVNRYLRERPALAAIALTTDGAILSSVANDDAFVHIFSRQIEALGREGDLALGISTSGNSANVVEALRAAGRIRLRSAALLGGDGGAASSEAELALIVPGSSTARIQEVQLFAGHLLCEWVEHQLGRESGPDAGDGATGEASR